jgi:hypothetical protein
MLTHYNTCRCVYFYDNMFNASNILKINLERLIDLMVNNVSWFLISLYEHLKNNLVIFS